MLGPVIAALAVAAPAVAAAGARGSDGAEDEERVLLADETVPLEVLVDVGLASDLDEARRLRAEAVAANGTASLLEEAPESASPEAPVEIGAPAPASSGTTTVSRRAPPRVASSFEVPLPSPKLAPAGGATAAELLRRAPGVHLSQHSGQGKAHQIFLRGFDAEHGQDVEVTVGGVPLNEVGNVHGHGYADLNFVPQEAVARMRVVEGPYDPRQGDFAVAGTFDVDLGVRERGYLSRASIGSFGLARGVVVLAPHETSEGTFLLGEIARGDGFGPSRGFRRVSLIGQGELDLPAGVSLRALASSYAAEFESAGVVREIDLERGGASFFDAPLTGQGGESARHQALVAVDVDLEAIGDVEASVFAVRRDLRLASDYTGYLVSPDGDLVQQTNGASTIGGSLSWDKGLRLFGLRQVVAAGVELRRDVVAQRQVRARMAKVDGTEIDARLSATKAALWAEVVVRPATWLTLRPGVRLDAASYDVEDVVAASARSAFGLHAAPKLVADVALDPDLHVIAAYGNGFRSPQPLSLGEGESSPFTDVHAAEIGARFRFDTFEGGLVAFGTYVEEDRVFDHLAARNLFVGPTARAGATAFVAARPLPWLSTAMSTTAVWATRLDDGALVPYAPPLVARVDVAAERPIAKMASADVSAFTALGASATSPRPLPFGEWSRPYALVDAALGAEWSAFAVSIEATNVLGAQVRDGEFVYVSRFDPDAPVSALPQRHFTAGAPFSAQLSLTVHL